MKQLLEIVRSPADHWVGDGFPVRTLFSYQSLGERISPFLLLDYAGPAEFPASDRPHGVGEHPHRGFETVTIVYQGEVEHRDSAGNEGRIGPGDVQWMTAASGILHEEMHSADFARRGGTVEMGQLWVNLPARLKMSPPRYQTILENQIPEVALEEKSGSVRVIAGRFRDAQGPAQIFTPVNLWELRLKAGRRTELRLPEGYTTTLLVLRGEVALNAGETAGQAELALFDREGKAVAVEARQDATVLLLNGEPIDEPLVGYGPFVMNTQEEIRRAHADYRSGRMGRLGSPGAGSH